MNEEKTLINTIKASYSDDEIVAVIRDPKCTPKVLKAALEQSTNPKVLSAILDSPSLTRDLYMSVFESSKSNSINSTSLTRKIFESEFFNKEVYDYYVQKRHVEADEIEKLISSEYATEDLYMLILDMFYELPDDWYLDMISRDICSKNVLKEIVDKNPPVEIINECLDHPLLDIELLESIMDCCVKDYHKYHECMRKALSSPLVTKDLLLHMTEKQGMRFTSNYTQEIVSLPVCDEEVLENFDLDRRAVDIAKSSKLTVGLLTKILAEKTERYTDKSEKVEVVKSVINNPVTNEEMLLKVVAFINQNLIFDSDQLFIDIINLPACSENVLEEIVSKSTSDSVLNAAINNPNAGKELKMTVYLAQSELTDDDVDELFAIQDLDTEDIIKIVNEFSNNDKLIEKAIDYPKTDTKLYKAIVDVLYVNKKHPGIDKIYELTEKILKKDLSESVLVDIINKSQTASIAIMASKHKNAGLNVVSSMLGLADKVIHEEKKKELLEEAKSLRYKIIADNYNIEEEENVTEMLRRNIEDGMSTMLWGPSGVGKSSRVFEIDPTATLLILKNGMLPEEVIGGKEPNGEPGKIYPPHWYDVLCEKCKKEPDRQHVLFIDEFTNVNDTIKNLVWEVIGNRLVNGHEEWPLPDNCSIVVAGNRPEESTAVRIDSMGGVMPAPLHNKIDSMLEVKFDEDEWQKWALETDVNTGQLRIHPIVYSFCVANIDKVMFSAYDPGNVTSPFLSPRKWECLSKAIYSAEKRGGERTHISDARVMSILGNNDISKAFIAHYERLPIDMNKITNGEYTEFDFPSVEDKLYALGMIIAKYQGDEIAIEDFIVECLGDEYLSIYNNSKRMRNTVMEDNLSQGQLS